MSDTEFGTDEASAIAQDIIKIAMTAVLGDERDKTIRRTIIRHLTPTEGEPAVLKLITASDVIALLGYTIGALLDDAKGVDATEEMIARPHEDIEGGRETRPRLRLVEDAED